MVAISLYRGNLHRVPDIPRRWLMPNRSISLKEFKTLLDRRSRSLFRSLSSSNPSTHLPNGVHRDTMPSAEPNLQMRCNGTCDEGTSKGDASGVAKNEVKEGREPDGGEVPSKSVDRTDLAPGTNAGDGGLNAPKRAEPEKAKIEPADKVDVSIDKEKRKKEVEEKLQVLNAKKHSLVQVLKQILNAEEELKRRSSMQGMATRPSAPLQVDVTNDSGSMTRHNTPRMGSEAHLGGDMEGGEADDASNHNMLSRPSLRMSSMSPSSESPLKRPVFSQHNPVPHPSRTTLAISGSPSRFAPPVQAHPPAVSVSGTNYIVSSPSPAASGGTSVFKDARLPSPWN